ncbi:MAG: hypothetical protein NC226_09440 [Bacteroides cellulosilyticus]|nr:hypothetical protein [Bacteroides cellulosilyticus]
MADTLIPTRPSNDAEHKIPKADKELLSYVVAMGVSNEVAFARFHPEFLSEDGKLNKAGKQACKQFFTYNKNRDYQETYKETLEVFLRGKKPTRSEPADTGESRTERAVKKLVSDVLDSIEHNDNLDPEALKDFVEVAKKLGVLKDEEERVEAPRRYLPQTCSACQYRAFVEGAIEKGDVENECLRCRALRVAQEHGFQYAPITLLSPIGNTDKTNE